MKLYKTTKYYAFNPMEPGKEWIYDGYFNFHGNARYLNNGNITGYIRWGYDDKKFFI